MFLRIACLLSFTALAGCGVIRTELRSSGGYTGHLLDKRIYDTSESKQFQLLRAATILAMASRLATKTVKDGKEADAMPDYLAAAGDEINFTASNLYPTVDQVTVDDTNYNGVPCGHDGKTWPPTSTTVERGRPIQGEGLGTGEKCGGYYANFESDIGLIEDRIFKVMVAALPREQLAEFIEDIGTADFLGLAGRFIGGLGEAAYALHHAAGPYRSGLELAAANLRSVGKCKANTNVRSDDKLTVNEAAACLGHPKERLFARPGEDLPASAFGGGVNKESLVAIMRVVRESCIRLPLPNSQDLEEVATRRDGLCKRIEFRPKQRPLEIKLSTTSTGPSQSEASTRDATEDSNEVGPDDVNASAAP